MEFNEEDDIPLNMNGLSTGGYDAPDTTLGDPSDYSTLNSLTAQTGSPNFDQLTPDFHAFDPGACDSGNFNVNDLSNYVSSNGAAPQSGSYGTGQGLLSLPQTNPGGLLASPPMSQGTGQSQYVDGNGNPIEGITVVGNRADPVQAAGQNLCQLPDGQIVPYRDIGLGYGMAGGGSTNTNGIGTAIAPLAARIAEKTVPKPGGIAGGGKSGPWTSPASVVLRNITRGARYAPLSSISGTPSIGGSITGALPFVGAALSLVDYFNMQKAYENAPFCVPFT